MCFTNKLEIKCLLFLVNAGDNFQNRTKPACHDYSECGPAEPQVDENYTYVLTKQPDESGVSPYEIPITLATSKESK